MGRFAHMIGARIGGAWRRVRTDGVALAFAIGAGAALITLCVSACSMMWSRAPAAGRQAPGVESLYRAEADDGTPMMRVRIARDRRLVEIGGADRLLVRIDDHSATEMTVDAPATVRRSTAGWVIRGGGGKTIPLGAPMEPPPALRVRSDGSAMIALDEVVLPGELWLHPRQDTEVRGAFDVVEHVPIELYLPGVVARELLAGWSMEAYQAQAIAARSYALHERQRRMALGSHFDVESTTQDQAYAGATGRERAHQAVRATRGLVLTWRGALLRTYYSSTTGGRAASARHTWPTGPGFEFNLARPIQASPRTDIDQFSPLYRWTVERDADALVRRFRAFGRAQGIGLKRISSLASIRVAERNEFGRPTRYTITDTGGTSWTLSAEQTRLACNFATPGVPEITRQTRINSGDFEVTVADGRVLFRGRGFGHGVGMSQYGAEGMARRGRSPEQILAHYYPGAQIERAY